MPYAPLEPILVMDIFPEMQAALLDLLNGLTPDEWDAPTVCTGWSVKDIAAHLLADCMSVVSGQRDGMPRINVPTWEELVERINAQNDLWVRACRRFSARILCTHLAVASAEMIAYFASLDPFAAHGPVEWAGSGSAQKWLEMAREYTEFWMHQQHIRDAVGKPGLKEPRFFAPLLATFTLALPQTFRAVDAPEGTAIRFVITGESGGEWALLRENSGWKLYHHVDASPAASVTMDGETAWRLFTKGISRQEAESRAMLEGDRSLGLSLLNTVSIIA
jgi:uncharacterized protein (TIGR03083 family)